jgi:formylglycine-generating enzyme required for sulfatase activity
LDAAGNLRGGSWASTVPALRCGMRIPIEADSAHALAGVRAVFVVR